MQVAMIGLGRMGANMARRLRRAHHDVVGYNLENEVTQSLARECGLVAADTLADAVGKLQTPRVVWLMLPSGKPTENTLAALGDLLSAGDTIIEGGNSNYQESQARAATMKARGINYLDVGTAGGIWGLQNGYALMVGGEKDVVAKAAPLFQALAPHPDQGWLHCGPSGAGHFVKMVHNGIEYGLMQVYAEGFSLLKGKTEFDFDLAAVSGMWQDSVIRSWLLELTTQFLTSDQQLDEIEPYVEDSGEGRWTINESIAQGTPAPAIATALMARFASQGKVEFGNKMLAMMRKGFGGHAIKAK
ncbi:MAG: decarboxylating 6-phosphogluconate dehydrogenase [Methylobacillus sp.]|nr:decarboxylating 6-phosphogluconate dehydrogenase [Methylobacillus sp.]